MSPEVEEEFQSLWARGVSLQKIARLLGYSYGYLSAYVKTRRDKFPYRHKQFSRETREAIGGIVRDGKATPKRVSQVLGIDVDTVRRWARDGKGRTDQKHGD